MGKKQKKATGYPKRLDNGEWGAKSRDCRDVGDLITVTTKSGKYWDARITEVDNFDGSSYTYATERVTEPEYPPEPEPDGPPTRRDFQVFAVMAVVLWGTSRIAEDVVQLEFVQAVRLLGECVP